MALILGNRDRWRWRKVGPISALVAGGVLALTSCGSSVGGLGAGGLGNGGGGTTIPDVTTSTAALTSSPPVATSVVNDRYVVPVDLDGGTLAVQPAAPDVTPTISEASAATEVWASSQLAGYHMGPLGFGIVTIRLRGAGVPAVTSLAAWVGFATASLPSCPMEVAPTGPTTTQPVLPSAGYAAIVVGATTGLPAVAYVARTSVCASPPMGPTVIAASEVVSIPWVAVGPLTSGHLPVEASLPRCGTGVDTSASGDRTSVTITLSTVVPDDPSECSPARQVPQSVDLGPPDGPGAPAPLLSSGTLIEHGPLGPVRQVS